MKKVFLIVLLLMSIALPVLALDVWDIITFYSQDAVEGGPGPSGDGFISSPGNYFISSSGNYFTSN